MTLQKYAARAPPFRPRLSRLALPRPLQVPPGVFWNGLPCGLLFFLFSPWATCKYRILTWHFLPLQISHTHFNVRYIALSSSSNSSRVDSISEIIWHFWNVLKGKEIIGMKNWLHIYQLSCNSRASSPSSVEAPAKTVLPLLSPALQPPSLQPAALKPPPAHQGAEACAGP